MESGVHWLRFPSEKKNERGKEEGKGRVQSLGSSNVCKRLQHDQYEGCKNFGSNLKDNKEKMQEIVAIRDDNCKIFYPGEWKGRNL